MSNEIPVYMLGMQWLKDAIQSELLRARAKHGINNTPLNPAMPDVEKLVILVEEVGEVARAMTYDEGDSQNLQDELLQVATMAGAWLLSLNGEGPG